MIVNGKHFRTIRIHEAHPQVIQIIDQRFLPHEFLLEDLCTVDDVYTAIKDMHVRGAGLIGATAAFGMYLGALAARSHDDPMEHYLKVAKKLKTARPTAVNLSWAVNKQLNAISSFSPEQLIHTSKMMAQSIADEDAAACYHIGQQGLPLIRALSQAKNGNPVNILTHCNAGWLAFVDYGSATAPIYAAHATGIPIHVWVDETRPRNQGARLTAWELDQQGIPYTVITDNTGGHLMQHQLIDMVLVGSDRTTYTGDVANKIGTYLKALAAHDNNVPFYVALPSSSFDWTLSDGIHEIPIEERDSDEVKYIEGLLDGGRSSILLTQPHCPVANYAFDVTPSRLISGLITERGICRPDQESILKLFPEHRNG